MADPARAGGPPRHHDGAADAVEHHPAAAPRREIARRASPRRVPQWLVAVVALVPLVVLLYRFVTDDLGGEPIDALERQSGIWALRFIGVALAVTPLRILTRWSWLAPTRRTLGLLAFTYATVHLLAYAVVDMEANFGDVLEDITERPYATVGFLSWLMLLPLAVTSTRGWQRRLGGVRWQRLHRLIYVVAGTASLHYLWSVKKDVTRPLVYGAILAALLLARPLLRRWRKAG